ncbi:hypothetical protein PMIT1313_01901 [Prochlorococcus marinus str. MIT 1313]|nr:hypothetical protein PMIT1313_01901 [Prochlorococcus marinus str. MIT 1313]KZR71474.1 hypothetical protein PMIT1318_02626 [Prochlorococcus marinus str. MIT 1318]
MHSSPLVGWLKVGFVFKAITNACASLDSFPECISVNVLRVLALRSISIEWNPLLIPTAFLSENMFYC